MLWVLELLTGGREGRLKLIIYALFILSLTCGVEQADASFPQLRAVCVT